MIRQQHRCRSIQCGGKANGELVDAEERKRKDHAPENQDRLIPEFTFTERRHDPLAFFVHFLGDGGEVTFVEVPQHAAAEEREKKQPAEQEQQKVIAKQGTMNHRLILPPNAMDRKARAVELQV